jgi:hypothetical protein
MYHTAFDGSPYREIIFSSNLNAPHAHVRLLQMIMSVEAAIVQVP